MVKIAIVGAGVSGLTCGVVLGERGHDVTIVAAEIGVTSLAAAAIWFPYDCGPAESVMSWALVTYGRLLELATERGTGVSMIALRCIDFAPPSWAFDTVPLMEPSTYLGYLQRRFPGELRMGSVTSLDELDADIMVNCSGVGARALASDEEVEPHRGQVVIVNRLDLPAALVSDSTLAYAIPRSSDCVLGGTNDISDNLVADPAQTAAIIELCQRELGTPARPSIREVRVGLRPFRRSGIRLEAERLADGRTVIHNYGHGGSGFTVSWGCAENVAQIVDVSSRA